MANPPADLTPLAREEELLAPFVSSQKAAQKLGAEMEKFGVDAAGAPIDYDGPSGVMRFFEELQRVGQWSPDSELPGGPILALLKDGASITLEPGSQFELSGAQHDSVHQVAAEIDAHMGELAPLSKKLGVRWLGLGFQPFSKRADYEFVPKQRYAIMRRYLPTRGSLALDMMLRTSTVQVNFDYASEADAMKKLRVGQALAPLTTALFANSPFYEGVPFGGKTFRGKVWLDMDPDRSGLIPRLFESDASYVDYVQWALDCPMFLVKRGDRFLDNAGQTFRDFWKNGFEGERATQGDWQLHLNTMFPEVRLKRTIEVRGADSQNAANAPALAALFAGIYYDPTALEAAFQLVAEYTFEEVEACRARVPME
ncbi:MAG: glutamate--cysteine ligase, partial [Proteobacteria bacterium]